MSHIEVAHVEVPALHFVDGGWIGSQTTFTVRSPLDWSRPLGDLSLGTIDTGFTAIEAARRASLAWGALGAEGRAAHLHRLADTITDLADDIATVESIDTGVLKGEMLGRLIPAAVDHLRSFAQLAVIHEASGPVTRRVPAGVTLILNTWKSPFLFALSEIAAALAAGNTVVLKPDEWAPLTGAMIGKAAETAGVPHGVLNVVQGVGEAVGDSLVTSPEIDRLTLAGSLVSARNNAVMAARNLHSYRLALPAKATYIVLEDADLEEVARAAAAHFSVGDPASLAGARVLASRAVAKTLLEMLAAEMTSLVPGDSRHVETTAPPMIHQQPHTRLHALIDRCRTAGDDVVVGGVPGDGPGLGFQPTLIRPRSLHSEAVTEDVFGPVVTFEVFDADHGAITLSDAAETPVIASVYTADETRAIAIAEQIEAVAARHNEPPFSEILAPITGSSAATQLLDFHSKPKTVAAVSTRVEGHSVAVDVSEPADR